MDRRVGVAVGGGAGAAGDAGKVRRLSCRSNADKEPYAVAQSAR